MEIDAALFDFGGVLVHEGSVNDFARLAPHADPAEVLRHAIGPYHEDHDHPWHRVERGELDMAEWYALTVASLAEAGIEVVVPRGGRSGGVLFTPNEPVVEAVREVRAAGGRTAVVTNTVRELSPTCRPTSASSPSTPCTTTGPATAADPRAAPAGGPPLLLDAPPPHARRSVQRRRQGLGGGSSG